MSAVFYSAAAAFALLLAGVGARYLFAWVKPSLERSLSRLATSHAVWWLERHWWVAPVILLWVWTATTMVVPDEYLLLPISLAWTAVAVTSATFAELMRHRTKKRVKKAKKTYPANHPLRLLAEYNHRNTVMVEVVHAIFLLIGLATLFLPTESMVRIIAGREGIMIGQFILMQKIGSTWASDKRVEKIVREDQQGKHRHPTMPE